MRVERSFIVGGSRVISAAGLAILSLGACGGDGDAGDDGGASGPPATVTGATIDFQTGNPVVGAAINVDGTSVGESGEGGAFSVETTAGVRIFRFAYADSWNLSEAVTVTAPSTQLTAGIWSHTTAFSVAALVGVTLAEDRPILFLDMPDLPAGITVQLQNVNTPDGGPPPMFAEGPFVLREGLPNSDAVSQAGDDGFFLINIDGGQTLVFQGDAASGCTLNSTLSRLNLGPRTVGVLHGTCTQP